MQSHAPISPTSTLPLIKWREWKLKFLFFTHITLHTLSTVCILCFLYIFIHHARWCLWFSCVFQCPLSCRLFPGRLHSVRHYRIPWGVWTYCLICITTSVQCWRKDFFFFKVNIQKSLCSASSNRTQTSVLQLSMLEWYWMKSEEIVLCWKLQDRTSMPAPPGMASLHDSK